MNKRGQQLTLGTVILIVLGIAVLVFLIFGFSTGWSNLWDRITSFSTSSNVETVKQGCEVACSSNEKTAYCTQKRTVKFYDDEGDLKKITARCGDLASNQMILKENPDYEDNGKVDENEGYVVLPKSLTGSGFPRCASISCTVAK